MAGECTWDSLHFTERFFLYSYNAESFYHNEHFQNNFQHKSLVIKIIGYHLILDINKVQ